MANAKARRDDVLVRLRQAADLGLGDPITKTITQRKTAKAADGGFREVVEEITVSVHQIDPQVAIKALELYGREIGMGFDGSSTHPEERDAPIREARIVKMTPAQIRAAALSLADQDEACERRAAGADS